MQELYPQGVTGKQKERALALIAQAELMVLLQ